jgi:methylphosphotriester-DNA--protein-cysteine methyltransferase
MQEFVICPVCRGEGGEPAATSFGELGWRPCSRCRETGEVARDTLRPDEIAALERLVETAAA